MASPGAGFINRDSSHLRPETFGVGCFDVISRHAPGVKPPGMFTRSSTAHSARASQINVMRRPRTKARSPKK